MKFSCDRCQTRYSIGDEKVRGKVLKIRCKTCGNIVVVREQTTTAQVQVTSSQAGAAVAPPVVQAAAGGTATAPLTSSNPGSAGLPRTPTSAGTPRAPVAPQTGEVEWYVAIKGKQHGPAKRDDVARLYRDGRITERTYLWNERMTQWTRLKDVPDFQALLSEPQSKRPPPPPPPIDDVSGDQQGAEIVNFEAARQQRMLRDDPSRSTAATPMNDPFAAVSGPSIAGGDGAPRDSTRVFIMNAGLHNRGQKQKVYAAIGVVVLLLVVGALGLDYKGVIEIPGLHSVVVAVAKPEAPKGKVGDGAAWDDAEEDPKLKCKLMPNFDECVKATEAKNAEIRRKRQLALGGSGTAGIDLSGQQTGGPGGGLERRDVAPDGSANVSDAARAEAIKAVFANDGKRLTTPTVRMETVKVDGSALDAEQVGKVFKENASAIQACVEQNAKSADAPHGKQWLVVTFEPKGVVSKAAFKDGATSASEMGSCITKAVKRWKIAPFPGDATDVELPLILSVN